MKQNTNKETPISVKGALGRLIIVKRKLEQLLLSLTRPLLVISHIPNKVTELNAHKECLSSGLS